MLKSFLPPHDTNENRYGIVLNVVLKSPSVTMHSWFISYALQRILTNHVRFPQQREWQVNSANQITLLNFYTIHILEIGSWSTVGMSGRLQTPSDGMSWWLKNESYQMISRG